MQSAFQQGETGLRCKMLFTKSTSATAVWRERFWEGGGDILPSKQRISEDKPLPRKEKQKTEMLKMTSQEKMREKKDI